MHLSLPTHQEMVQTKQNKQELKQLCQKSPTLPPSETTSASHTPTVPPCSPSSMHYLVEERFFEIMNNLEDHRGSPPILTPTTLAMVFDGSSTSDDISRQYWADTTTTQKDSISASSLQCFLSQLQKTTSRYIPSLEMAIKEDNMLGGIPDGDMQASPRSVLDHLTRILAAFNQTIASTGENHDHKQ